MNENIDLTKILKDCPKGTKLYSTIFGEITFCYIDESEKYPIKLTAEGGSGGSVSANGKHFVDFNGECTIFPSKEQRDWSKFTAPWYNKKERFDYKTLQPFDKVLVRTNSGCAWEPNFFGYIDYDGFKCVAKGCVQCIPYNEDTKHLIGTVDEAPEYYRYWEEWR